MNLLRNSCIGLFLVSAMVALLQLWFSLWSADIFIKILITLAIFFVVALVLLFIKKESLETRKLKDDQEF